MFRQNEVAVINNNINVLTKWRSFIYKKTNLKL